MLYVKLYESLLLAISPGVLLALLTFKFLPASPSWKSATVPVSLLRDVLIAEGLTESNKWDIIDRSKTQTFLELCGGLIYCRVQGLFEKQRLGLMNKPPKKYVGLASVKGSLIQRKAPPNLTGELIYIDLD